MRGVGISNAFIDANDLVEEGTFVYSNGNIPGYLPWNVGQPDDSDGHEDVVQIVAGNGTLLNDVNSGSIGSFICEFGKQAHKMSHPSHLTSS